MSALSYQNAYRRAMADLRDAHPDEFRRYLDERLDEMEAEARAIGWSIRGTSLSLPASLVAAAEEAGS